MTLSGRQRQAAIARWLDRAGIPYIQDADGWPQVLESQILDRLGGQTQNREPELRL